MHVINYTCSLDFKYFPFKVFSPLFYPYRLTASESVPYVMNARVCVCRSISHSHGPLGLGTLCVCACMCLCACVRVCMNEIMHA